MGQRGSFDPGAVMIAGTPEFPERSPQKLSHFQFVPRVGFAYQVEENTVIRASFGKMYLPTTGNPNSYASSNANVALSDQAFAGWHASTDGGRNYISTWANPFPLPAMFSSYSKMCGCQPAKLPGSGGQRRFGRAARCLASTTGPLTSSANCRETWS